jgi:peptidyl-prolyl cis-trans isomerase A (cyclophilin A)
MKIAHTLVLSALTAAVVASVAYWAMAQQSTKPAEELPDAPQATAAALVQPNGPSVIIDTSMGRITCQFYQRQAPKAVANFIALAEGTKDWTDPTTRKVQHNKPFYDGTVFHRVIPDFMIQGGCPEGSGRGGPGYKFVDEFHPTLKHTKGGFLSMANSGPNTNGSQFFVTVAATPWLDNRHSIFGEVIEGYDVVEKISKLPRDSSDRPRKEVKINSLKIERS